MNRFLLSSASRRAATSAVLAASIAIASATSDTWVGTTDTTWATTTNWAGGNVPGTGDTATFNTAGNGNTWIDLGAGVTVATILFDTADAAAYTIGAGGAGVQTLTLNDTGGVTINSTVANNQLVDANIVLGSAAAGTTSVTNYTTGAAGKNITFTGTIQGGTDGTAGIKTVNASILSGGSVTFTNAITPGGATGVNLIHPGTANNDQTHTGALTLSGDVTSTLNTLRATGGGTVVVDGQTVTVAAQSNYGATTSYGKFRLQSGSAAFNGGIQSATSSGALAGSDGMAFIVNGGTFSASFVALGRARNMGTGYFTTAQTLGTDGFQVNGGTASTTGNVTIGGSNSSAVGQVTGTGSLTVGGTFILGQNASSGRTNFFQVTGGTLTVNDTASGINIGRGTSTIASKGQLLLTGGTTTAAKITFGLSGGLAGSSGNLTLNGETAALYVGSGGIVKAATNTFTEVINLTAGTLGAQADWSSPLAMNLAGAGVAIKAADASDVAANIALSGTLSGSNGLTKAGAGTLALSGTNTFTGTVTLNGGTLSVTSDAGLGDAANAIAIPTTTSTLAAVGAVTTARAITVGAGVEATFAGLAATDGLTITGTVGGDGGVAVAGQGMVTLAAANTYAGNTTVQSGTLVAANTTDSATSTGAVNVAAGALGGDGSVGGAVTVAAGGGLRPGAVTPSSSAVGDLATGPLTLAGGSLLYTEFASAASYDVVSVGGNLQTSGASPANPVWVDLRVVNSAGKWTTPGTYAIIQYAGSFTGNANDLFEVTPDSVQAGLTYTFASTGNAITLTIAGQAPGQWKVDADGNWSTAANWEGSVPNSTGATAILGPVITAGRLVTVDAPVTVGELVLNNANPYTVGGTATLSLDATTGAAAVNVLTGDHVIAAPLGLVDPTNLAFSSATDSLTLGGTVSGGGGLAKSTAGDLVLSGSNTFTGGIDFTQGTLTFANGGLGQGTYLSLADATLVWAAGNIQDISNRAVVVGGTSVTFNTNGNDVTLMNPIGESGTGMMVKAGAGTLTLGEAATHTGGTTISEGTLQLGIGGATGGVVGDITDNATLAVNLEGGASLPNRVTGTGSLVHAGSGALTLPLLAAANTFSGTTTVLYAGSTLVLEDALALQNSTWATAADGGTLGFGTLAAATLGGLAGDQGIVLENTLPGAVALSAGNNNQDTTYAGALSGAGSLAKVGTGRLTLTGTSAYTGATNTNAGVLEIAAGGSLATGAANAGTAGLLLVNGGSLTASAQSDFNGGGANGIHVDAGTAAFNGGLRSRDADGSLCVVNGGLLTTTNITLRRTNSFGNGADPTGPASTTSGLVVNGGELQASGALNIATSNSSASVLVNGGLATVAGAVNIGMSSNNRWSILEVRGGEFVSTEAVNGVVITQSDDDKAQFLVSGGTATAEKLTFGGAAAVTGTARLTVSSGSLYLGEGGMVGNGSVTAQVQFNGGTIGAKAAWATDLAVVLGGAATVKAASATDEAFAVALNGGISGTGSLTKTGAGTLTLGGTVAYTGNTTVEAGTLVVATNTAATFDDASTVTIAAGAVLNLPNAATDIVGSLVVNGTPLANGVYDAAHPATTGYLTGPGKIQVGLPGYAGWAATNAGGQAADLDYDNDGVKNGVEYFMGETGSTFTANPGIVDGKVTWPKSAEFTGSYAVETSPDLATWTPTTEGVTDTGTSVEFNFLPLDDGRRFVRLSVTP